MGVGRSLRVFAVLTIVAVPIRASYATTNPEKFTDWNATANPGIFWRFCKQVSGGFFSFYKRLDCNNEVPYFAGSSYNGGNAIAVWCRDVDCGDVSVNVVFRNGSLVVNGKGVESHNIPRGLMGIFLFHPYQEYDGVRLVEINAFGLRPYRIFP